MKCYARLEKPADCRRSTATLRWGRNVPAALGENNKKGVVIAEIAGLHAGHLQAGEAAVDLAAAHRLEHLLHLRVLTQKLVHFLHARARATRDALAPRAVDGLMMVAL